MGELLRLCGLCGPLTFVLFSVAGRTQPFHFQRFRIIAMVALGDALNATPRTCTWSRNSASPYRISQPATRRVFDRLMPTEIYWERLAARSYIGENHYSLNSAIFLNRREPLAAHRIAAYVPLFPVAISLPSVKRAAWGMAVGTGHQQSQRFKNSRACPSRTCCVLKRSSR